LIQQTVVSLGTAVAASEIRIVRIRDTLNLSRFQASESLSTELEQSDSISRVSEFREIRFDKNGGLEMED
jgi:hypothetical protein